MKTISKTAARVFQSAIDRIQAGETAATIGKAGGAYMQLHVERIRDLRIGDGVPGVVYSFAHYYEQNGDIMRDADVELLRQDVLPELREHFGAALFVPVSLWQDNPPIRNEVFNYDDSGKVTTYHPRMQADIAAFCNMWARNLKDQQGL